MSSRICHNFEFILTTLSLNQQSLSFNRQAWIVNAVCMNFNDIGLVSILNSLSFNQQSRSFNHTSLHFMQNSIEIQCVPFAIQWSSIETHSLSIHTYLLLCLSSVIWQHWHLTRICWGMLGGTEAYRAMLLTVLIVRNVSDASLIASRNEALKRQMWSHSMRFRHL